MIAWWIVNAALADEPRPEPRDPLVTVQASGHLKTFSIALFPYEHPLLPRSPTGQTVMDARLNIRVAVGPRIELLVAHHATPTFGATGGLLVANTGVAPIAPELVRLGWQAGPGEGGSLSAVGRTDRLRVKIHGERFDVVLGRQPVSFGSGAFFTPLDLVNPFTPATIDTEYKPGVDAIRLDAFATATTQVTLVTSWAGQPLGSAPVTERDLASAVVVNGSIGATDLTGLAGFIRGDVVVGGGAEGALGPVRIYGDAALTLPTNDEKLFGRVVVGASHAIGDRLMISGEMYVQTLGTRDPNQIFTQLENPRYATGELWLAGIAYAGIAASFEITPLLRLSSGAFVNLTDPSLLLAPGISWSVADNAEVVGGAFTGIGRRPQLPATPPGYGLRSEFGLYPAVAYLSGRVWF